MVDEQRLQRMLRRVLEDTAWLRSLRADAETSDDVRLGAIKYTFVTAIEGCARVAQHLGASEGWRAPESNADALVVLTERRVIDDGLGKRLARAVGFRNILVHQYADVDDARVLAMLEELDDLDAFVGAVSRWVAVHR